MGPVAIGPPAQLPLHVDRASVRLTEQNAVYRLLHPSVGEKQLKIRTGDLCENSPDIALHLLSSRR